MSEKMKTCPLLAKPCIRERCMFWVEMRGPNPNTGEQTNFPDCTIRWMPALMLQQARETHSLGAAVESHRNEAVKAADTLQRTVSQGNLAIALQQAGRLTSG